MKPYPLWKYVSLILALTFGALFALPNLYGEDPAVQISLSDGSAPGAAMAGQVTQILQTANLQALGSDLESGQWIVRFATAEDQLKGADAFKRELGRDYVVALNLASKTPEWLRKIGAKPMNLGLDLRGGVHFLLEVDIDEVKAKAVERIVSDVPTLLRNEGIRYSARRQSGDAGVLEFADADRLEKARRAISKNFSEYTLSTLPNNPLALDIRLSEAEAKRIVDFAVQQNLTTLRNRVNQLGVAEPVVQRQGANRIVVQLPGVQDTTRVKDLLGATATLEYRAVADEDAYAAVQSGIIPAGTQLFYTRDGRRPVLLKREIIAGGDNLVDASATVDENGGPAVSVILDGPGSKRMFAFTERNVGKPMAVLFKEREVVTNYNDKGEPVREHRQVEEIISIASIRGVFGKRFQTTGLQSREAHNLALLLKAGALAAPVEIVEERTVGPSLGADNIRQGFNAAVLGLLLVIGFMLFYYRVFGIFAICALLLNLLVLVAILSILQATLTMPGIVGIVLHMGIAVDANVLIYERIREELRDGAKPHAAIDAGYERAFLTIFDANVTGLIATVVLFALGEGPIKGFAITLAIGIITSQYTAIVGTRALAQMVFAKRRNLKDLPVW
ncbi:protein translocase subunit SecD [Sinimarinibacterium sp. NLF-5-8]|uniref:protein translocase subunit SecD n=1 Tax=Sinimarinibacterium sp. NLF-5-8 TaxID=2698684 RepID=UPI00137C2626|nr:protein translocase subunit SecD [Sinimarinibacterium sp. NLF-5-8]QHS09857.1 protein translocase subunit SecD [Sinimarinibacterium sp. NLF-5-8]